MRSRPSVFALMHALTVPHPSTLALRQALSVQKLHQHPTPAAGTPAGACAWQWLQEQGATVTCICGLVVDADAERLQNLLTSLPALGSISRLEEVSRLSGLTLRPHPGAGVAAAQDFLAGAARAIGCCSCLRRLHLQIDVADNLADQVPTTVWQYLAKARALEHLDLVISSGGADTHNEVAIPSVAQLIAGLAGLSQLRALTLSLHNVCTEATLPACVSRLAQLTSLGLFGLRGLRCAPGWALVCRTSTAWNSRAASLRATARTRCRTWTRWRPSHSLSCLFARACLCCPRPCGGSRGCADSATGALSMGRRPRACPPARPALRP